MTVSEAKPRRRSWYARSGAAFRWVHVYVSMLGFASLMFFGFTGLTLNHPSWFGAGEHVMRDVEGQMPTEVMYGSGEEEPDRLAIAEWLRSTHRLSGAVSDFEVDDYECMVVFKGPGYAADIFIDRETGEYMLTETTSGVVAIMNDLHKGRDSGPGWSWVIDVSAVGMMIISVSGFGLLFYIRRRRTTGLITAVVGTVLMIAAWMIWVP